MMTDPIADMFTRIRNAQMTKKSEVLVPYSSIKYSIAKVLELEKYVSKIERVQMSNSRRRGQFLPDQIRLSLRYSPEGKPAITVIERVSKPGRRVYCKYTKLPRVLNDYGVAILSTPKGVMTNRQARDSKLGGEVLCNLW